MISKLQGGQQAALMCVELIYGVGNTCMYRQEFTGFGRPSGDDGIQVSVPRFYVELTNLRLMTDNNNKRKTRYLENLEMLLHAYKTCYGNCPGNRNVHKLSLLITMFESSEMFEKIAHNMEQNLIIDIDRDVDYSTWSKPETWNACVEKTRQEALPLTYESLKMERSPAFANSLTDMLPPVPLPDDKLHTGLTYTERDKFKTTINNLMNRLVFNDNVLDYAIGKALTKLCNALLTVQKAIEADHTKNMYAQLFSSQEFYYANNIGTEVSNKHKEWRAQHLDEEDIDEEPLRERADDMVANLLGAGVFDDIEDNASRKQREEYKGEIDLSVYDCLKRKKAYKLYACFRGIYSYNDDLYTVNKEKAGRLLFKIRRDAVKIENFFRFELGLKHIYNDINDKRKQGAVESIIDNIDFSTLRCRFSEDEVEASGIKAPHAATVLAMIDCMKDKAQKTWWFCFYCILLERNWIEDNISGFCKNMNDLFDIKLDRSALNKTKKNEGTDILKWSEADKRLKEKKNFGLKFKRYIDFYLEYKKQKVLND